MYEERFQIPNVKRFAAGSAAYPEGIVCVRSVRLAPFGSDIPGVTVTPDGFVFDVEIASNCAVTAATPLTTELPVKPLSVILVNMLSTALPRRSRCSA